MITLMLPDLQEKCHKEIFDVIGSDGIPSYAVRQQMPFVEAMLLEVQRFFSIVPISGPRRVLNTCKLGNYTLPRNTTVLIGLQSVHMDGEFWSEPEKFKPERFLDENMKTKNIDRLLSFGAGRRKCLGDQLARHAIFTYYCGILQKFKLKTSEKDLPSLNLAPGITLSPRPYKIIFEKR
jgi:cytochrome P450